MKETIKIAYEEMIDGHIVKLLENGDFIVDSEFKGQWKDERSGKPWIPVKRKSFVSLAKQYLRD